MVNDEIREMTRRFVETLRPAKIILFGSYANDTYRDDSDYDFYIIMPGKRKVTCATTAKAYMSLRGMKRRSVDIIVNNEAVFAERSNYFSALEQTVAKEGIKVYEK